MKTINPGQTRRPVWRGVGRSPAGVSMLELMLVMVILIAVSVMILPMVTIAIPTAPNQVSSPQEIATMTTLHAVRDAISGQGGLLENLAHKPEMLPQRISDLVKSDAPERIRREAPELAGYYPFFGIGWRGPYLLPTGVNSQGEPTVVDGWGNEIELQIDLAPMTQGQSPAVQGIAIVSGGPNGKIETTSEKLAAQKKAGPSATERIPDSDDFVLFIPVKEVGQ